MMHTQICNIKGMHCASCAATIEKTLKKVEGVHEVQANFGTETAKVSFDPSKTNPKELSKKIEPLGYSFIMPTHASHGDQTAAQMGMSDEEHAAHTGIGQSKREKLAEVADMKTKVALVMPLAIFSIFLMA